MDWTFRFSDLAIIFATFFGPIFAVFAQGKVEERREAKRRRLALFHTLMRTRGAYVSPEHVNALNAIPLEFSGKATEFAAVRSAWKHYLNHTERDANALSWAEQRTSLAFDLLRKMGHVVGYAFDDLELEKQLYMPIGHTNFQNDQDAIRQGLASVFRDGSALPLKVVGMPPPDPKMVESWRIVLAKLEAWLDRQDKLAKAPTTIQQKSLMDIAGEKGLRG